MLYYLLVMQAHHELSAMWTGQSVLCSCVVWQILMLTTRTEVVGVIIVLFINEVPSCCSDNPSWYYFFPVYFYQYVMSYIHFCY